ncbi:MAG: biotin/lipoyl-binding protein, partial [Actinobacteria bacterium]|nr:biotin/lipoyl-binding protein [Actinomycetota bacterium]
VETQCLADSHGNVVVISTRDCSLQRRHQELVEEAPAPFLTDAQIEALYTSSKAILKEVGYLGAGTCEFLVAKDGTISFLEVNTRLQVEHPVSEEVTGIDLVREQFRIAEGQAIGYDDPVAVGHSFEFRINGEDPGLNFMPAPGPVNVLRMPGGPGVRVDSGVTTGDVISGAFDSLLAKLIVTGSSRADALERSRRALDEFEVAGLPTVLPFHRKIVRDPAFTSDPFTVYTRWIETEFVNDIEPWSGSLPDGSAPVARHNVVLEVGGKRVEVSLPTKLVPTTGGGTALAAAPKRRAASSVSTVTGDSVKAPMQATVVKLAVADGDKVVKGDLILVLEAMKMEQPLTAHKDGTITGINATVGSTVSSGHLLMNIAD